MGVRIVFRCETCAMQPDAATHRTFMGQLRDRTPGEYRDVQPGGWLLWTGGGALGSKRYACAAHRDELIAQLRRQYGAIRCSVLAEEPYTAIWPDGLNGFDEHAFATLLGGARGTPSPAAGG